MTKQFTLASRASVVGLFCVFGTLTMPASANEEAGMNPGNQLNSGVFTRGFERGEPRSENTVLALRSIAQEGELTDPFEAARQRWRERLETLRQAREARAAERKAKRVAKDRGNKTVLSASKKTAAKQRTGLDGLIARYASEHGVPYRLARAVVQVESTFRPNVTGGAGEIGLMQIKLSTARGMGYKGSRKALYNPATNLYWGMKYLGKAYRLSGGTTCGTILKYNAGHGAKRMNPISSRYCGKVRRIIG